MNEQSNRLHFFDNLRAFVVLWVVVLHGAMVYMDCPLPGWYVANPQQSVFFTAVAALLDVPVMMTLFFIAAYFALPSLMKRDQKTFWKDKFIRIGAPWIVGVLFLAPLVAYLTTYSRQVPMGLFEFWATDFWGPHFQQSVYWFLGILFLFFLLLSTVYWLGVRAQPVPRCDPRFPWKMLAAFWTITTLALFLLSQRRVSHDWFTGCYLFVFQPWRVPLYLGYFALGIIAWLNGWFTAGGYQPRRLPWAGLWVLSGAFYFVNRLPGHRFEMLNDLHRFGHDYIFGQSRAVLNAEDAILFNTFCLSSVMAGVAFFQRYANIADRFSKNLTASSYGIYYVHPLILFPLAWCFMDLTLPLYVKAPAVILLALLLSWTASALVLRKAPFLRRAF